MKAVHPIRQLRRSTAGVFLLLPGLLALSTFGQSSPAPERQRFNDDEFYKGLKKRGLTDLLARYLVRFPPEDPTAALLLQRDIRLAQFVDPSLSLEERLSSLSQANLLLEDLIKRLPEHPQNEAWRMELGSSLIYQEAERLINRLLYFGGTDADRAELAALMVRAVQVLGDLHLELAKRYDGLDHLPAAEYDRMERRGEIDRLESEFARSEYLLAWSRFYRAIAVGAESLAGREDLREVLDYLVNRSGLLHIPHSQTHYQAQALILAGMAYRRSGDSRAARKYLTEAGQVVAGILEDAERQQLDWVVILSNLELARSYVDTKDFASAQGALDRLREHFRIAGSDFGQNLMVALLEFSVYRRQAEIAHSLNRKTEAEAIRSRAVHGLRALAGECASDQDQVYAALYDLYGQDVATDELVPFERCALLAGLLGEAEELRSQLSESSSLDAADTTSLDDRRRKLLEKAVSIAGELAEADSAVPDELRAEAGFNLGVALFQQGKRLEATTAFERVARAHPRNETALQAATLAVQIARELQEDPALNQHPAVAEAYLNALTTLTRDHADSEAGQYWRFFHGQQLASSGQFDAAAASFSQVKPDHPYFAESQFLAAQAVFDALSNMPRHRPEDTLNIQRKSGDVILAIRHAIRQLDEQAVNRRSESERALRDNLKAHAVVLLGEVYALDGVERWDKAVEAVEEFENRHPEQDNLLGRVLRVRMLSLEGLGRHDEAESLIPKYVVTDPHGAAATLQGLFEAIRDEIRRDREIGRSESARDRAETAFVIAGGLYELATEQPDRFPADVRYALRIQMAESAQEKRDFARALELFRQCFNESEAGRHGLKSGDARAIRGMADALFELGRFREALPLFNRLFKGTEPGTRQWWSALLMDLTCRTETGEEPKDIIKSIQQQKFFDAEMGGPDMRRQFDALLTRNEREVEKT